MSQNNRRPHVYSTNDLPLTIAKGSQAQVHVGPMVNNQTTIQAVNGAGQVKAASTRNSGEHVVLCIAACDVELTIKKV